MHLSKLSWFWVVVILSILSRDFDTIFVILIRTPLSLPFFHVFANIHCMSLHFFKFVNWVTCFPARWSLRGVSTSRVWRSWVAACPFQPVASPASTFSTSTKAIWRTSLMLLHSLRWVQLLLLETWRHDSHLVHVMQEQQRRCTERLAKVSQNLLSQILHFITSLTI